MPVHDDLGLRMKIFYEQISKTKLMRRTPVIIRIDGKTFHTFTKGFQRPFDEMLIKAMQETARYLCENIQGCVLGYSQSDEITLVLTDYRKLETDAWFDYEVQKMCSIAASMATMAFNKQFRQNVEEWKKTAEEDEKQYGVYLKAMENGAMFDARCFNIPKEEVVNCLYWRQLDASRNSIQMVGQANFSHKELQGKSCREIRTMLLEKKSINWDELPAYEKYGSCVRKEMYAVNMEHCERGSEVKPDEEGTVQSGIITRSRWIIDRDIPIFKGEGREYIERLITFEE